MTHQSLQSLPEKSRRKGVGAVTALRLAWWQIQNVLHIGIGRPKRNQQKAISLRVDSYTINFMKFLHGFFLCSGGFLKKVVVYGSKWASYAAINLLLSTTCLKDSDAFQAKKCPKR
ncbi:MAG: hypothetical protein AAGF98_15855 [Cyanobacteria bacterium P01_H01_bin.153]